MWAKEVRETIRWARIGELYSEADARIIGEACNTVEFGPETNPILAWNYDHPLVTYGKGLLWPNKESAYIACSMA